ncbi:hypothetical protein V6N13_139478 [Hibiscus sabdariffa]
MKGSEGNKTMAEIVRANLANLCLLKAKGLWRWRQKRKPSIKNGGTATTAVGDDDPSTKKTAAARRSFSMRNVFEKQMVFILEAHIEGNQQQPLFLIFFFSFR